MQNEMIGRDKKHSENEGKHKIHAFVVKKYWQQTSQQPSLWTQLTQAPLQQWSTNKLQNGRVDYPWNLNYEARLLEAISKTLSDKPFMLVIRSSWACKQSHTNGQ